MLGQDTAGRPRALWVRALLLGLGLAAAQAPLSGNDRRGPLQAPPFLDPESGQRAVPEATVTSLPPAEQPTGIVHGYGIPFQLDWGAMLAQDWSDGEPIQPDAVQLAFRTLGHWTRTDLSGSTRAELCLYDVTSPASLELLHAQGPGRWTSTLIPLDLWVRGLVALAGNGPEGPGHADGRGGAARFRTPCGLLQLPDSSTLVADPEAHVIRAVAADGTVSTLLGAADQPGHYDGSGTDARFDGPTFLAARPHPQGGWVLFVADSGNHAIRMVHPDGSVGTLAGSGKGYQDAQDPSQAKFHTPRGLALADDGTVFVADSGNNRIRRIGLDGRVTTLAGNGHIAGEDGRGEEASFWDLKGMAWHGGRLLVADGHAIRSVTLDGEVRTLAGNPRLAGKAVPGEYQPARVLLSDPFALDVHGDRVVFTERGNHCLTMLSLEEPGLLWRLAGHPDRGQLRYGLLRDGYSGTLDPEDGTLGEPMGVAFQDGGKTILVSTGHGLVQATEWGPGFGALESGEIAPAELEQPAGIDAPCEITEGLPQDEGFRWMVDLVPMDGVDPRPIRVASGENPEGGAISFSLRVDAPGRYHRLVRLVNSAGVTDWLRANLSVFSLAPSRPDREGPGPEGEAFDPGAAAPAA